MKVKELKEILEKMPDDKEVIIFDGPSFYTPSKVYVCKWTNSSYLNGKVIID